MDANWKIHKKVIKQQVSFFLNFFFISVVYSILTIFGTRLTYSQSSTLFFDTVRPLPIWQHMKKIRVHIIKCKQKRYQTSDFSNSFFFIPSRIIHLKYCIFVFLTYSIGFDLDTYKRCPMCESSVSLWMFKQ